MTGAKQVGYYQSSDCVDAAGFETCYDKADEGFATCVNKNCAGGSKECADSCGGNMTCMQAKCPNLGIDCIHVCECIRNTHYIECAATSCWNQVYSCEYQQTASDLLDTCINTDIDAIPFFPAPENAPGGCSCNLGRIAKVQVLADEKLNECVHNMTEMNRQGAYKQTKIYGDICVCCGQSSIISSIWDLCPKTIPSLLGADAWYDGLLAHSHWDECGLRLEDVNCAADLGYSNETQFHTGGKFPPNGTETLYNTGGVISTPVSGNTFTWTFHNLAHPITAAATNKAVPTKSESGGKAVTSTATSGTGDRFTFKNHLVHGDSFAMDSLVPLASSLNTCSTYTNNRNVNASGMLCSVETDVPVLFPASSPVKTD
ncbi:hypothetical protein BDV28DRAFT_161842 [Aspergillus coremiiformis]|uniref:Uncharacterized protein n=1 Tax=Aspergillus coremiiformis TaxID=138285 RepID=A0A5N6Z6T9_9EURO|nr:hypothetical protein BDV28DRAFT_161842 [Aspergillus coremiiformis]